MSWYIHPSKQLRDDELPPELVVTNRDGSIEQAYVPYDASDKLRAENDRLRELVKDVWGSGHPDRSCGECDIRDECRTELEKMRRHGTLRFGRCLFERRIEERMRELGIEVDA